MNERKRRETPNRASPRDDRRLPAKTGTKPSPVRLGSAARSRDSDSRNRQPARSRKLSRAMILSIVRYGHPVLRKKGARIEKITPEVAALIADMQETMRAARGVGLAAQQVGHALQLAIVDVSEIVDRPSTLHLDGQPADVAAFMPVILINPEVTPMGEPSTGPEGCLSFPEIYADITRPESIEVRAMNAKGDHFSFQCGGLLARAVQHEVDHLNGILFIDRMDISTRRELKPELEVLQEETKLTLKQQR